MSVRYLHSFVQAPLCFPHLNISSLLCFFRILSKLWFVLTLLNMHFSVMFISFCMNYFNDLYDYEIDLMFQYINDTCEICIYTEGLELKGKCVCVGGFSSGPESGE